MRHFVVRSTELETEDGEHVLSLEKDLAFEAIAEVDSMVQWCFFDDIVNPRRQNQPEILDS